MGLKRLNNHCYVYTSEQKEKPSKLQTALQVLLCVSVYIFFVWSYICAISD